MDDVISRGGIWTTEFWLAVVSLIAAAVLAAYGRDTMAYAFLGLTGTYPVSRTVVKSSMAFASRPSKSEPSPAQPAPSGGT